MGADISRIRFDAFRDHAGVVLQQGRLLLDGDWNELVAVLERRLRANAADLDATPKPGIAGVAVVPRTTPDGFKVTLTAGALSIGRGRMYVDGLLAENHGKGSTSFDPLLAEPSRTADTPYDKQPYWPVPTQLPTTGSHLAYLDVWHREVTQFEAPDLVEPAVGVDTTARIQTAWQVRLHELGQGQSCASKDDDIAGWKDLIAPSGGRLSTGTIPVTGTENPCVLPPTDGYRGLENQTYRVEIHDVDPVGKATFKWSRDNASVVSSVVEVLTGGTKIRPASLGKDDVLRFDDGQWVEILDDQRELSNQPGEMRLIEVDDDAGTISFTPALPVDLQLSPADAASRHLRVRRWDQRGVIKSSTGTTVVDLTPASSGGVIAVPAGAVVLERGVTVELTAPTGAFRRGDFWVFAARTADSSVEPLDAAPPAGTHHHYARLGVLTFPDDESDCRTPWPPDCECEEGGCSDCTVCVTPESHASGALTVQAAVDMVHPTGGTVCLAVGTYQLDERGVRVFGATSVTIRGQGLRTVLVSRGEGIRIGRSAFVTVEDLTVMTAGEHACVSMETTAAVTVQRLTLVVLDIRDLPVGAIRLEGVNLKPTLVDNVVVAQEGISAGGAEKSPALLAELRMSGNLLVCRDSGVRFEGHVAYLRANRVTGNTVLRASRLGIGLLGAVGTGHSVEVHGNSMWLGGAGVLVGTSGFSVRDNDVTGTAESLDRRSDGITVAPSPFGSLRGPVRVECNTVRDIGGIGVGVFAPVETLLVTHNLVERALDGIVMTERGRASTALVSDNTVTDMSSRESDKSDGPIGIQVVGATRATVESNVVNGVGGSRNTGGPSTGIRVLACVESRVAGNAVDRVGFAEHDMEGLGIGVQGPFARTQVAGNTSRRQPVDVDEDVQSGWLGLLVGTPVNADGFPEPDAFGGFIVAESDEVSLVISKFAGWVVVLRAPGAATVDSNIVGGGDGRPAVLIGGRAEVVVSANQCHQRREARAPALLVAASAATVSANRLRGGEPSGALMVNPERLAVLGNLSSTGIRVFGNPLEAKWQPLNPDGV